MKCRNCDTEMKENQTFCEECGTKKSPFIVNNKKIFIIAFSVIVLAALFFMAFEKADEGKTTQAPEKSEKNPPAKQEIELKANLEFDIKNWPKELVAKIYQNNFNSLTENEFKEETQANKLFAANVISRCRTEMTIKDFPDYTVFAKRSQEDLANLVNELKRINDGCIFGFHNTHQKDSNGNFKRKPKPEASN